MDICIEQYKLMLISTLLISRKHYHKREKISNFATK